VVDNRAETTNVLGGTDHILDEAYGVIDNLDRR
jgi:hypothetical protein